MAKRQRVEEDRLVTALRLADAPCVVGGTGSMEHAHVQPVVADLLLVTPEVIIRTLPNAAALSHIVNDAAADVESRLSVITENISRRIEGEDTSVHELTRISIEEAEACGLSRRHGIRVALEAVLGSDASDPQAIKELAAALQGAASGPRSVSCVLAILEEARRVNVVREEHNPLNVVSVLCFGETIRPEALDEWRAHQPQMDGGLLQPLITYYHRPAETVDDDHGVSDAGDDEEADAAIDCTALEAARGAARGTSPSAALWHHVDVDVECAWEPLGATPAVCAELGASREGVVVLDGLVSNTIRSELLGVLLGEDSAETTDGARSGGRTRAADAPPSGRWERTTVDGEGLPRTWGLRPALLRRLESHPPACVLEVQSRLARLYPEYHIGRLCPSAVQPSGVAGGLTDEGSYCCTAFVANAAVYGNHFQWHVDADPASLPPSRWLAAHGDYANGTAGKPLLVSLLVYLDAHWQREWDAETLFLNDDRGVGLLVQPRPARAVLMHADVLHRVSTPSLGARRPRYSLVWKLVFVPKADAAARERETICRPEWGLPTRF